MQAHQLKRLIDAGDYRPEPGEIAQAMLERRAVRALLIGMPSGSNGNGNGNGKLNGNGQLPLSSADQIQSPPAVPRQAA